MAAHRRQAPTQRQKHRLIHGGFVDGWDGKRLQALKKKGYNITIVQNLLFARRRRGVTKRVIAAQDGPYPCGIRMGVVLRKRYDPRWWGLYMLPHLR